MKIVCSKNELLKSINIILKAVPSKTTMTILECILVDASSDVIKFTSNDMEMGIETVVSGVIEDKGSVALDARLFSDIVRKLPDGEVFIETNEKLMTTIVCEKANFRISGRDADEFAALPFIEKNKGITMSQFSLKELVRQTIFSISANDTNKIMTGELFEIKDEKLRVASLDGHRISIRNILLKEHYPDTRIIVPGKTLTEISKILSSDTDSEVMIYFSKNHILFEFDETKVVSRLIEGNYFRVDQMISGDYETKIRINRKEMLDCIDRSMLMIREDDRKPIILNILDDVMELKISSQIGSMNETINIEKEGKDILIGFNPKFLMDALRVIDDETVQIYYMNSKAPCFIRDDENSYIYLILPVNFVS